MKKIAFITMQCIRNYGSVLQTYATQKFFEKCGYSAKAIDYFRKDSAGPKASVKAYLENNQKWNKNFLTRKIFKMWKYPVHKLQFQVFGDFLEKNVSLSPWRYFSEEELENNVPFADYFCVGSDQMWNPEYNHGIEEPYFLSFVSDKSKCFTFSTSIGKEQLFKDELENIISRIKDFRGISVREKSAKDMLEAEGLCNVRHIIDPTLLLTAEEWEELAAPREIEGKYLLVYQLNKNRGFDAFAVEFAKKNGLDLYRINLTPENMALPGKSLYLPSPERFLSAVLNASYVLTDSFHGTSFCLNFHKNFAVIPPEYYSGRISDILDIFDLQDRIIDKEKDFEHEVNYENFDQKILSERKKARDFVEGLAL